MTLRPAVSILAALLAAEAWAAPGREGVGSGSLSCWLLGKVAIAWAAAGEAGSAEEEASRVCSGRGERSWLWRSLARAYREAGMLAESESRWVRAVEEQEGGPELSGLADSLLELAAVRLGQGRLDAAQEAAGRALAVASEGSAESLPVAAGLHLAGVIALRRGRLEEAEGKLAEALRIRQRLDPESLDAASTLNNLGNVAINQDRLDAAVEYHRRALELRRRLDPDGLSVAASWNNLGLVALYRGEHEASRGFLERALAIKERLAPESMTLAATLGSLGRLAASRGDLDRAGEYLGRALEIRRRLQPRGPGTAHALLFLAGLTLDRGEVELAREHAEEAHEIFRRALPGSLAEADALSTLGEVALEAGRLPEAQRSFEAAYALGQDLAPGGPAEPVILHRLGRVARARGDREGAESWYLRGIEALERRIGRLAGTHELRGGFRARYGRVYRDMVELMLDRGRPREAFAMLERSRARAFLAMLAEKELAWSEVLPEALLRADEELERRHLALRTEIRRRRGEEGGVDLEELRAELAELLEERERVVARIRRASPRLAALRYPEPVDVEQALEALEPGTALLAYSVGEEGSDLFVLSHEAGLSVHRLDSGEEELRRGVSLFLEQIQRAGAEGVGSAAGSFLRRAGRHWYQRLVAPAEASLQRSSRLLIVPDGPLHRLPFAALVRQPDEAHARGEYLIEWKPLHRILSATVYRELGQRQGGRPAPGRASGFLAFGDPELGPRSGAEASVSVAEAPFSAPGTTRVRGFELSPLPASRDEVRRISALFPAPERRVFVGAEATEERAKALAAEARYLHFATHALADASLPMGAGLVLARDRGAAPPRGAVGSDPGDDGLLEAWEIVRSLRLDSDLVVLSACASGLGDELAGEGLMSLTRAFQSVGARSVASTLWTVDDRVTAELMLAFYGYLRRGMAKDLALRAAQLDLIRRPLELPAENGEREPRDASAPYYWAAFQLVGLPD